MNRFSETVILPLLKIKQPGVIIEIGSESGLCTEKLLRFCRAHGAVLHAIDPAPKFDARAWETEFAPSFIFHQERSLDALLKIGPSDAVLIDGDHNWYTVHHELLLIDLAARQNPNGFPLVLLHDVGWPYGRRDMYYNPDDIPEQYRQPCARQGMRPGEPGLSAGGGLNPHLCNALHEGGARNGVLTAVEDFMHEREGAFAFAQIPGLQGLGVLCAADWPAGQGSLREVVASLSADLAPTLLLEAVERDRNDLQVRSAELGQRAAARQQALDDLRSERELLRAELARERELVRAEIADERRALHATLATALDEKAQALTEVARLRAELARQGGEADAARQSLQQAIEKRDRLLAKAATARQSLQDQAHETTERLRADAEAERRQRDDALAERDRLLGEVAAARSLTEQMLAERDELREAIEAQREEAAAERATLQLAIEHRDRALAEAETTRRAAEDRALEIAERLRAEAAAERRGREQALAQRAEVRAEVERLRAAVEGAVLSEEEQAERSREAGQRLARIDALLAMLVGKLSGKKWDRLLETAQHELFQVREDLDLASGRWQPLQPDEWQLGPAHPAAGSVLPGRRFPDDGRCGRPVDPPSGNGLVRQNGSIDAHEEGTGERVDVVVCVHDALDDVKSCLASVARHTDARHGVIVVDDGSAAECAAYLREFAHAHPQVTLLRNETRQGYTKAANRGLRQAGGDVVVLLNSDTLVSPQWLERLVECARSDPNIGIVGPLSSAASYQSVPERYDANGDWALNPLPPGWDVDRLAATVAKISGRSFPRVPFVNGFCFAVTRAVIDAIGYFDEEGFPDGYGEENDYCLRAADAGFALAIADHAYVYHAKSRSYSHDSRRELGKAGRGVLNGKHGAERLAAGEALLRDEPTLAKMRLALGACLKAAKPAVGGVRTSAESPRVLVLLPVSGGGGGAHSVVQEAAGMRRLGAWAQVAIRAKHLAAYRQNYPSLPDADRVFFAYQTQDELMAHAAGFDAVVATIHTSMPLVAAIVATHRSVLPAYYIQDYEPYFYPEGSAEREAAARSYTLVPDAVHFAKTRWLCDTVAALHGVEMHKVTPSLDHEVYYPPKTRTKTSRLSVVAMIRPGSPRRGAARTMDVLRRLKDEAGRRVAVHIFGCTEVELAVAGLAADFPYTNHGVLTREEVAELLRKADVFLDLSDYQAFGRTGLEAMACGCAVVVPARGGTGEYAVDRENALVVDTAQPEACFEAARELIRDRELRERLQHAGVATAREFTIERAARSELDLLSGPISATLGSARTIDALHAIPARQG